MMIYYIVIELKCISYTIIRKQKLGKSIAQKDYRNDHWFLMLCNGGKYTSGSNKPRFNNPFILTLVILLFLSLIQDPREYNWLTDGINYWECHKNRKPIYLTLIQIYDFYYRHFSLFLEIIMTHNYFIKIVHLVYYDLIYITITTFK